MRPKVAIVYNEPAPSRYAAAGEGKAIVGVLDEVAAVSQSLNELGYPSIQIPLLPPIEQAKAKLETLAVDVVFNLFEGFDGRPETEAEMAGILEELRLRHTGCPRAALALALDKVKVKELLRRAGINTPRYQVLSSITLTQFSLDFPCIVKPSAEDASHGLTEESVTSDFSSLERQVERISRLYGGKALVEEYLVGREFNTIMVGNKRPNTLAVSEIVYALPAGLPRILTFAAKWEPDSLYYQSTKPICPAEIEDKLREEIAGTARRAYRLVGCRGYARVDMRLDSENQVNIMEVNPNPDISPTSGASLQIEVAGMAYSQFVEKVIGFALERN